MIKGNLNAIKTFIETSQHSQHAPSPVPEQQYDDEGPECEQVDSQEEKTEKEEEDNFEQTDKPLSNLGKRKLDSFDGQT